MPDGHADYHRRCLVVECLHENELFGIFCLMNGDARRKIAVKVNFVIHEGCAVEEVFRPEDFA